MSPASLTPSQQQLTYTCVCGNGTAPDVTSFANTLPFFICQQTYIQCIANHPNDDAAQQVCTRNQQCGSRNATAEAIAATSSAETTASSTTSSGSASGTGSATSSETAASTSSGSAAVHNVAELSTGAFAILLAAAFKLFI